MNPREQVLRANMSDDQLREWLTVQIDRECNRRIESKAYLGFPVTAQLNLMRTDVMLTDPRWAQLDVLRAKSNALILALANLTRDELLAFDAQADGGWA